MFCSFCSIFAVAMRDRLTMADNKRTDEEYYIESKRLRNEVLKQAEQLKGHPMRFIITNHITMRVEITKTDLKTIVSKNVGDDNSVLTSRLPIQTGLLS